MNFVYDLSPSETNVGAGVFPDGYVPIPVDEVHQRSSTKPKTPVRVSEVEGPQPEPVEFGDFQAFEGSPEISDRLTFARAYTLRSEAFEASRAVDAEYFQELFELIPPTIPIPVEPAPERVDEPEGESIATCPTLPQTVYKANLAAASKIPAKPLQRNAAATFKFKKVARLDAKLLNKNESTVRSIEGGVKRNISAICDLYRRDRPDSLDDEENVAAALKLELAVGADPSAEGWINQMIAEQAIDPEAVLAPLNQMLQRWSEALAKLPEIHRGIDNIGVMLACVAHTPDAGEYRTALKAVHDSLCKQRKDVQEKILSRNRQFAVALKRLLAKSAEATTKQVVSEATMPKQRARALLDEEIPTEIKAAMFPKPITATGLPSMRPVVLLDVEPSTTISAPAHPLSGEQKSYFISANSCGKWMRAMMAVLTSLYEARFEVTDRGGDRFSAPGMEQASGAEARAYRKLIKLIRRDAVNAALSINGDPKHLVTVGAMPLLRTSTGILVTHTVYQKIAEWNKKGSRTYKDFDALTAAYSKLRQAETVSQFGSTGGAKDHLMTPEQVELADGVKEKLSTTRRLLRKTLTINRGNIDVGKPGAVDFEAFWGAISNPRRSEAAKRLLQGHFTETDTPFSWLAQAVITGAIVPGVCTFTPSNDRAYHEIHNQGSSGTHAPYIANIVAIPGNVLPSNVEVMSVVERFPEASFQRLTASTSVALFNFIRLSNRSLIGAIGSYVVGSRSSAYLGLANYAGDTYGVGRITDSKPNSWLKSCLNTWATGWRAKGNALAAMERVDVLSAYGPADRSMVLRRSFSTLSVPLISAENEEETLSLPYGQAFWVDYGASLAVSPSRASYMNVGNNGLRAFLTRESLAGVRLSAYTRESVDRARVVMWREVQEVLVATSSLWPDAPIRLLPTGGENPQNGNSGRASGPKVK